MKYLTIIRHAKSSWDNPGLDDLNRPLNERGKKAIVLMGEFLKKNKIRPDRMLCSPAVRARKTAEGIARILEFPASQIQTEREIYYGSVPEMISVIFHQPEKFSNIFLIGHEPLLSALIFQLSGMSLPKFPTCAVYRISWNVKKWSVAQHQKGKCEFFVYPKSLKAG